MTRPSLRAQIQPPFGGGGTTCSDVFLQKAFDTVDHGILLDKLKAIGVSDTSWFYSYLVGRSQCVEVDGVRSSFQEVTCGVTQGSILGPLLFLVYINDMHRSVDCQLSLYADDSALIFSHSDPAIIAERLSHELSSCKKWLIDNKLSLHVGKTECIMFGSSKKLKKAGALLSHVTGWLWVKSLRLSILVLHWIKILNSRIMSQNLSESVQAGSDFYIKTHHFLTLIVARSCVIH